MRIAIIFTSQHRVRARPDHLISLFIVCRFLVLAASTPTACSSKAAISTWCRLKSAGARKTLHRKQGWPSHCRLMQAHAPGTRSMVRKDCCDHHTCKLLKTTAANMIVSYP